MTMSGQFIRQEWHCPRCGAVLDDEMFCPGCGEHISDKEILDHELRFGDIEPM